jgi:hypothetical protein
MVAFGFWFLGAAKGLAGDFQEKRKRDLAKTG